ncbi:MAG: PEGA domain-containing protein [Chitinivibrionales bacterium]|nr:PEGA domain-containing protein [Chitinivibrionales bacterium]
MKSSRYSAGRFFVLILLSFSVYTFADSLVSPPLRISITTTPDMADIFVDDNLVGVSPVEVTTIGTGNHSLRIVKDGYETLQQEVTITTDSVQQLSFTLIAMATPVGETTQPEQSAQIESQQPSSTSETIAQKPRARKSNDSDELKPYFATAHSAFIPGWGQMIHKQYAKGAIFMGATAICAVGIGYSINQYDKSTTEANRYKDHDQSTIDTNKTMQDWIATANKAIEKKNSFAMGINVFIAAASAMWLYNMFDIIKTDRAYANGTLSSSFSCVPTIDVAYQPSIGLMMQGSF